MPVVTLLTVLIRVMGLFFLVQGVVGSIAAIPYINTFKPLFIAADSPALSADPFFGRGLQFDPQLSFALAVVGNILVGLLLMFASKLIARVLAREIPGDSKTSS